MFSFLTLLLNCCLIAQPFESALDEDVHIRMEQIAPQQKIEIYAQAEDKKGITWVSHGTFQADDKGVVDLDSSYACVGSSYDGVDGMGLFWSMLPASGDSTLTYKCKDDCFKVTLKAYADGTLIGEQTVVRYLKMPSVTRKEIKENGIIAALFMPQSTTPLPTIITLSGSNGGLSENRAKLLAAHGFAVIALAYFGVDVLPGNLENIPLEYFEKAFAWLKTQPNLDSSHIGLYGISRGAELALILGSFFPNQTHAIVAVAPSSVVFGGLSETPTTAWMYQGKPILPSAPVPQTDFSNGKGESFDNPACTRDLFVKGMKNVFAYEAAAIPVEKIRCPVMLISGGDDQMWPSDLFAEQIVSKINCTHCHYPHAGHGINIPNLPIPSPTYFHPVSKKWFSMGGSRAADATASVDSWKKLVIFYKNHLQ